MSSLFSRAALVLAGASMLAGCHARWNPLGSAPTYYFRTASPDGTLNKPMEGTLTDEGPEYASGFKYTIPAPGALIITAKPASNAVQLDINVFSDGNVPIATTKDNADKKLTVQDVQAGDIWVVVSESWKEAQRTKFKVTAIYKPTDPDAASGAPKTQAGAQELPADKGFVQGVVDYSAMQRTHFWKISLPGDGGLTVKFVKADETSHLTAEFISPSGAPEKIDPMIGIKKDELSAGDYFVKVTADDAGDFGKYSLATTFKAGDTCKNGGPACTADGAEDIKIPSDSKTGEVDFSKAKQAHWYKFTLKEKGKMSLNFKILQPPRGSHVTAFLLKSPDDEGEKIGSGFLRTLDPGDYFVRIMAPDAGDFAKYAVASIFQPDNFIGADVVEIGKLPCMLTVNAGTNQNVRQAASVTIVGTNGAAIDTGVIDTAFPNLSKVKPFNQKTCNLLPPSGAKVQIAGQ